MPQYDYRCTECGYEFSRHERINDDHDPECERCGREVEQVLSAPTLQFKGSGWYVTDYRNK